MLARLDGALENWVTGFGTMRAKTSATCVKQRRYMTQWELDALQQSGVIRRMNALLPTEGARDFTIIVPDEPEVANLAWDTLDGLSFQTKAAQAGTRAREYGGAAIWICCDGGGAPDEQLDLSTVRAVKNLVVMDRFELMPVTSMLNDDPLSKEYGLPTKYQYTPPQGGTPVMIHGSRIIRFVGIEVPDRLKSRYQSWGAPAIEGAFDTYAELWGSRQAGAELAQEYGHMVYKLNNLREIMSGDGRAHFDEWMALQAQSRSTLRASVIADGQDVFRMPIPLGGFADIYEILKEAFSADCGVPQTKLWGSAPGGLSTTDQAGSDNWSGQIKSWQDMYYRPAINRLLEVVFASQQGPTGGKVPSHWSVEIKPYEVPTAQEEAQTTQTYADVVTGLVAAGVMSGEEARETMRSKPGLHIGTDEHLLTNENQVSIIAEANSEEAEPDGAEV